MLMCFVWMLIVTLVCSFLTVFLPGFCIYSASLTEWIRSCYLFCFLENFEDFFKCFPEWTHEVIFCRDFVRFWITVLMSLLHSGLLSFWLWLSLSELCVSRDLAISYGIYPIYWPLFIELSYNLFRCRICAESWL